MSPVNQPATSGKKPSTASPATDPFLTVNAAYPSAPARPAALAAAARIDIRLGRREAARYDASPSRMLNGSGALPTAMTIAFATAATASAGSGQRRRAAIGLHTTNARRRRWSRSCGYGPADTASVISAAHTASRATASHWGQPGAGRGPRDGGFAERSLATPLTVTSGCSDRIVLEDDGDDMRYFRRRHPGLPEAARPC